MFPSKGKNKTNVKNLGKPKAVKVTTNLANIESFIDKELATLNNFKKKPPQPKINQEAVQAKKKLRESMEIEKLNEIKKVEKPEDLMNVTSSKFEGFAKATKFNETGSSFKTNNSESKNTSTSMKKRVPTPKQEPFVINKFPERKSEQTKEIIEDLNKNSIKDTGPKIEVKSNEISISNKLNADNPYKIISDKNYEINFNKINNDEEEIPGNYGDFEKEEDLNKYDNEFNKFDDEFGVFGAGQEFNNINDDLFKPKKKQKKEPLKSKRELTLQRIKDLKDAINLEEETLDLLSIEYTKENAVSLYNDNNMRKMRQVEAAVNTILPTKVDSYTMMENFDFSSNDDIDSGNNLNNKVKKNKTNEQSLSSNKETSFSLLNYQPITNEAYQFFTLIGPYIENVLLNNINKYILQKKTESHEATGMSKIDKEFHFPQNILEYIFPNCESDKTKISFKKILFFDTKPNQIALAVSILPKNYTGVNAILSTENKNSQCHLIILHSIFKNQTEKIFFSFSQVNDMVVIGESENVLIAALSDGQFGIYDLYNNFNSEQYYLNYDSDVSITRENLNEIRTPQFKLILPIISIKQIFNYGTQIKKIIKKPIESNIDKIYQIYSIDQSGYLINYSIRDSYTHNLSQLDKAFCKPEISFDLNDKIKQVFNISDLTSVQCIDMKIYGEDILYLLTNFGLCAIKIEGKENFVINAFYNNTSITNCNNMTSFDISDDGNIIAAFNDYTVQVYASGNNEVIYLTYINDLNPGATIDKIVWSNIICKNAKGKLIRKTLLANFYVFTTKNDFVIFDLNQKKVEDIRKVKRKKELGLKQQLTRKNSIIEMSDSLFTDYSNFILFSNSKEDNKGSIEMHRLSLRKQYYEEGKIHRVNENIINKILSLNS